MSKAREILKNWKENLPGDADLNEAEAVAKEFFPQIRHSKTGSHQMILVSDIIIKFLEEQKVKGKITSKELQDYIKPFNYKGEVAISYHGKKVNKYNLDRLIKAIDIQEMVRGLKKD